MSLRTLDRASDVYTVEQVGRTQELTPEGFLLCRDVPVARIGTMLYGPGELQDDDGQDIEVGRDGIVYVERGAEDLFRPETIASLNGKPITDDHPDDDVTPETWRDIAVGIQLNPHQGTQPGEEGLLLVDFLITDPAAIKKVRARKREVSCGYDASYQQTEPGKARQSNIIFNHTALVEHGRCGSTCATGDSKMKLVRKPHLKERLLGFVRARDEEGARKALEGLEVEDEMTEGQGPTTGGDTHVHVYTGGGEEKKPQGETTDESAEGEGEHAPPWFKTHVESTDKRFKDLETGMAGILAKMAGGGGETADEGNGEGEGVENEGEAATEDEMACDPDGKPTEDGEEIKDPDGEKDPLKSEDKKTRDAATVAAYREIASKSEIILPGVKLATQDAVMADPYKNLCLLRRRVLAKATRDSKRGPICASILGKSADLRTMNCSAVTTAFNAIAEVARRENNRGATVTAATHDSVGSRPRLTVPGASEGQPVTAADINKRNREFWEKRGVS